MQLSVILQQNHPDLGNIWFVTRCGSNFSRKLDAWMIFSLKSLATGDRLSASCLAYLISSIRSSCRLMLITETFRRIIVQALLVAIICVACISSFAYSSNQDSH